MIVTVAVSTSAVVPDWPLAVTVMLKVPADVGVPDRRNVLELIAANDNPGGAPEPLTEVALVAEIVSLYDEPSLPVLYVKSLHCGFGGAAIKIVLLSLSEPPAFEAVSVKV